MNAPLTFLFAGCLSAAVAAGEAPSPWAAHKARLAPGISRQASKRMSSMTEADWDANDRDRDGRYQLDKGLDSVGISPGMTVGEVGAGAGYLVFKLAARVGPSGKVFAEDIKAYVLEMLKTRAQRRGLANIETIVGTADDPRMPAATFDAVFMHATIQFVDKPVALFNALIPALKPGGRIVLIEQPRGEHLETFRQAALRVERLDDAIVPPFTLYVLTPAGGSRGLSAGLLMRTF